MAFRDDREALKQKTAELEAELESTERELEAERANAARSKELEAQLVAARKRLHELGQRSGGKKSPGQSRVAVVAASGVMVVGAAVGAMVLVRRAPAPPPPPVANVGPAAQAPQPAAAPAPKREVTVRWNGRVKTATGSEALPPGTACTLDAVLRTPSGSELTISCGGKPLYRSTDPLNGMSQHGMNAGETAGLAPGTARLWLTWDDIGARTGARSQASVNTGSGVAAAWKETEPSFRVEIEVDGMSEPTNGTVDAAHSEATLPFKERIQTTAKVTATVGGAAIAKDAVCDLTLAPAWGQPYNCRATVTCDGKTLYGNAANGFSSCTIDGDRPTAFADDEHGGDPVFHWDVEKRTAKLVVRVGDLEWSADFAVDPAK